jgi:transposase
MRICTFMKLLSKKGIRRLSDSAWGHFSLLLDNVRSRRGRPGINDRSFIDAALWILRTRAPWRDLPPCFGAWQTAYKRFSRWSKRGVWSRIYVYLAQLQPPLPARSVTASMDSTSVRVHQHGAPKIVERAQQAVGKSRGGITTKLHAVVTAHSIGRLLAERACLSPGNTHDVLHAEKLTKNLPTFISGIAADKAYDAASLRTFLQDAHLETIIPFRSNNQHKQQYNKILYRKRNEVERLFASLKQFRRVATRYDRAATIFFGFIACALTMTGLTS